jgi:endonuclease/exonuclease/phosphatase family metal-dependent hydrolase
MRFLSYNVRHAQGITGLVSNARIAQVIARLDPAMAGLQEVWRIRRVFDQPRLLGALLGMDMAFHEVHQSVPQMIGNLVLSKTRIIEAEFVELPGGIETRGLAIVRTVVDGVEIAFATTHLSLGRQTRTGQIVRIAEALPRDVPLVLTGDFNAEPEELEPLREVLDLMESPPLTYSSLRPRRTPDHIAYSHHWELVDVATLHSLASDHLPLYADLRLRDEARHSEG